MRIKYFVCLMCITFIKLQSQTAAFNPNNTYKIQNQNGFIELGNSTSPTVLTLINPFTGLPYTVFGTPFGNFQNYYQIKTNKEAFSFEKNIISETGLFSSTISSMQFNFISFSKTTSNPIPAMIIAKLNGKVGIGYPDANSINAKLDLVNNDKITSFKTQSNYTNDLISANLFSVNRDKTKAIVVQNSNNNKENFVVMGNGATHIGEKWGNGQYKDAMLSVYGQVVARSFHVTIDPSSWADYVFDEKYKLLPLNELEVFYKTNKHLPEVPNEDEVLKNGVDVSAMQILLLKKIEELTLYIVEQQKEIEKLKRKHTNE